MAGVKQIFLAGERERRTRALYAVTGIPLNPVLLSDLKQVVSELGMDLQGARGLAVGPA